MANEKQEVIETTGENGEKIKFKLLDIVTVDDVEYALLLPEETSDDDENEVLIMRLRQDGNEYAFEEIEDAEFNKVASYIEEFEDELDE